MTTRQTHNQPQTQQLRALYFIAMLLESAAAAYRPPPRMGCSPYGPCVDAKFKPL
jgi:hypothetical protein